MHGISVDVDGRTLATVVLAAVVGLSVLAVALAAFTGLPASLGDDRYEPNDAFTTAATVDPGTHGSLVLASDDRDVYALALEPNQTATATIRFDHAGGDLDLEAYDPEGRILARSESITDDESVEVDAGERGRYYVLVYGHEGASNDYALELRTD